MVHRSEIKPQSADVKYRRATLIVGLSFDPNVKTKSLSCSAERLTDESAHGTEERIETTSDAMDDRCMKTPLKR
eukprot:scaffold400_cov140-Skeletonema_menzelii.AAC.1